MNVLTQSVSEALDIADQRHWTKTPPRAHTGRLRYLATCLGADEAAGRLHLSSADVRNLGHISLSDGQRSAIDREIRRIWQFTERQHLHETLVRNNGQVIVRFRARFGFSAARGSSNDSRLRFLAPQLLPQHTAELFEARHRNAGEDELRRILGDAIGAAYFFQRLGPHQTQAAVALTDLDFVEFRY
ncbi:telomere-protecting terminal protein Tpg [Streptomyces asiaticus]|uniref:telomere-protecting terminal protein Tpg n=1 Tax=Streptomyces asiaticus TaxID=114695 RepID=UPI003F67C65B